MELEDLKAMEAAATSRPWKVHTTEEWESGIEFFGGPNGAFTVPLDLERADVALLEALRNLAPETLRILDLAIHHDRTISGHTKWMNQLDEAAREWLAKASTL